MDVQPASAGGDRDPEDVSHARGVAVNKPTRTPTKPSPRTLDAADLSKIIGGTNENLTTAVIK